MSDVRDILEQGVRGFDPGDGFDKTRRRVRRRQMTRRLVAAGTSLAVAAAGGVFAWRTFTDRGTVQPRPAAQPSVGVPQLPLSAEDCDPASLRPSYVPNGFDASPKDGPGGGIPADAWPGDAAHYQGGDPGTHITVTIIKEPGGIPQGHGGARPITMLGASGTIGAIEDGYSVEWVHPYPLNGEPCAAGLWIAAYGVSENELRGFAESLQANGKADRQQRGCPAPSFRPTYLPRGFSPTPRPGPGPWPEAQSVRAIEDPRVTAIHFLGPRGRFLELTRGVPTSVGEVHEPYGKIRVAGVQGEIGESHFGYAADWLYGRSACPLHGAVGHDVSLAQVRRFVTGLRPI